MFLLFKYVFFSLLSSADSGLGEFDSIDEEETDDEDVGAVPRLRKISGLTRMLIKIEKIGVKDLALIEPYISVSVRGKFFVPLLYPIVCS